MVAARTKDLLIGAVMVGILAGCAASSTPTAAPATPSPAATSSPSSSPAGSPDRVMFSGRTDCDFPEGFDETTDGQITTWTGKLECVHEASDPRASGMETGVLTMMELDLPGFHANKWFDREASEFVITNAGGSWRSTEAFGADMWDPTGAVHTTGTSAYIGKGGYAGLRMRLLFAQGVLEPGDAYIVMGWIEPAA